MKAHSRGAAFPLATTRQKPRQCDANSYIQDLERPLSPPCHSGRGFAASPEGSVSVSGSSEGFFRVRLAMGFGISAAGLAIEEANERKRGDFVMDLAAMRCMDGTRWQTAHLDRVSTLHTLKNGLSQKERQEGCTVHHHGRR